LGIGEAIPPFFDNELQEVFDGHGHQLVGGEILDEDGLAGGSKGVGERLDLGVSAELEEELREEVVLLGKSILFSLLEPGFWPYALGIGSSAARGDARVGVEMPPGDRPF